MKLLIKTKQNNDKTKQNKMVTQVYRRFAETLTEMECFKTQTEHDASLNLKIYLLQVLRHGEQVTVASRRRWHIQA